MRKIPINVRILQDSIHAGIPSIKVNHGGQDIFMWGLPKLCECHMALVSIGLGPKNLESVSIEGPSVYYGDGSIYHVVYLPSLHLPPYSRQLTNLVSSSLLKRIYHPWFSSPLASKDNNGVNISIRKLGGVAKCACDIEVEVVDNFFFFFFVVFRIKLLITLQR